MGKVVYTSGVDGKLDLRAIVDQLPAKSVLLIDEADKALLTEAMMVNKAEAVQLHHAIVTHFGRKPIFWAFIGTFSAIRSGQKLTYSALEKTLGTELHRD